ncbi:uncharacterized protein VTP21DRAFT_4594 [Calcarisporiella thermophila]|uniref:uncharacterized protein n=1 Tax=Calcarisporiella thermophila TaxID=911321 RepID=UPI003744AD89
MISNKFNSTLNLPNFTRGQDNHLAQTNPRKLRVSLMPWKSRVEERPQNDEYIMLIDRGNRAHVETCNILTENKLVWKSDALRQKNGDGNKNGRLHSGKWDELASQEAKQDKQIELSQTLRGYGWKILVGVDSYYQAGLYEELLVQERTKLDIQIINDLNVWFRGEEQELKGIKFERLADVLIAYSHYSSDFVCSRDIVILLALMLQYLPAEDTFWLFVATVENYLQDLYSHNSRRLQTEANLFGNHLRVRSPNLANHLIHNNIEPANFATHWFASGFGEVFSSENAARIWDVFFLEGIEVWFRVGMEILQELEPLLFQLNSQDSIVSTLLHPPLEPEQIETIIETIQPGRVGFKTLDKLAQKYTRAKPQDLAFKEEATRNETIASQTSNWLHLGMWGAVDKMLQSRLGN